MIVRLPMNHPYPRIVPQGSWQKNWEPQRPCRVLAVCGIPAGLVAISFKVGAIDSVPIGKVVHGPVVRWSLPGKNGCIPGMIVSVVVNNPTSQAARLDDLCLEIDE